MAHTVSGLIPNNSSNNTFSSTSNITNAYTNSSSTSYAQLNTSSSGKHTIDFTGFDFSSIPDDAIIRSVTIKFKALASNTTRVSTFNVDAMYNTTDRGDVGTFRNTSATTKSINAGSWSVEELKSGNFKIHVYVTCSWYLSSTYIRIYGMDVEVKYALPGEELGYIKVNGSWEPFSQIYVKTNGSWIEQSDASILTSGGNLR